MPAARAARRPQRRCRGSAHSSSASERPRSGLVQSGATRARVPARSLPGDLIARVRQEASVFFSIGLDGGQKLVTEPFTMHALSLVVLVATSLLASFCAATCPTYSQISLWVVDCHQRLVGGLEVCTALTRRLCHIKSRLDGLSRRRRHGINVVLFFLHCRCARTYKGD